MNAARGPHMLCTNQKSLPHTRPPTIEKGLRIALAKFHTIDGCCRTSSANQAPRTAESSPLPSRTTPLDNILGIRDKEPPLHGWPQHVVPRACANRALGNTQAEPEWFLPLLLQRLFFGFVKFFILARPVHLLKGHVKGANC